MAQVYFGEDIHILRNGETVDLLAFFIQLGGSPNITISLPGGRAFTPVFTTFSNISVSDFEISAAPFFGSGVKINCLRCKVTFGSTDLVVNTFIHIHDKIVTVWLTPNKLTLYEGMDNRRFSVHAMFTDDAVTEKIVADISGHFCPPPPPVPVPPPPSPWTILSPYGSYFTTGDDGYITVTNWSSPISADDAVGLSIPFFLRSPGSPTSITGNLSIDTLSSKDLVFHGKENLSPPSDYTNILFVPDGFLDSDKALFEHYVEQYVNNLTYEQFANPYNHLGNSVNAINYWSLFLPSAEDGGGQLANFIKISDTSTEMKCISFQNYVMKWDTCIATLNTKGSSAYNTVKKDILFAMPTLYPLIDWAAMEAAYPTVPPSSTPYPFYTLTEIIHYVLFPSISDSTKTFADKKLDWDLIRTNIFANPYAIAINEFTYKIWRYLSISHNIDHVDTFLGVKYGETERYKYYRNIFGVDLSTDGEEFSFHPFRILNKQATFNKFIASASPSAVAHSFFNSTTGEAQLKSGNNIVIVSNATITHFKGLHIPASPPAKGNSLCTNTYDPSDEYEITVKKTSFGGGYRFAPKRRSRPSLHIEEISTCIHEFSHNFLLDEYGGNNMPSPPPDGLNTKNLQMAIPELGIPNPTTTGTFHPNNTHWRWPRIKAIGITADIMGDVAANKITLKSIYPPYDISGKGMTPYGLLPTFSVGKVVMLRKADLMSPPTPENCPLFTIVSITGSVFELTYIGHYFAPDTFTPSDYGPGSLLIYPQWENDAAPGHYWELVHKTVLSRMNTYNMPLRLESARNSMSVQKPYVEMVDFTQRPSIGKYKIVGLYIDGGGYSTEIYHPTGSCIMRDTVADNTCLANSFCHVCKYIIVDKINPLAHPLIDFEYAKEYPET